jgi:hypothetical protein
MKVCIRKNVEIAMKTINKAEDLMCKQQCCRGEDVKNEYFLQVSFTLHTL